jgi:hypothetical protein
MGGMIIMLLSRQTNLNCRMQHERRWRGSSGWLWVILFVGVVSAAWLFFSPAYYSWALGRHEVDVHIFCDTADLRAPDMKAFVLYDKVALTPLAVALGVCRNRPPREVKVFFVLPAEDVEITPFSVRLKRVPYGPMVRVLLTADGKKFHVDVADRRLVDDTV